MTESTPSRAVVEMPNIADADVLTEILLYTGTDAVRLVLSGGEPEAYSELVFGVVSIFMGSESVALPPGWDISRVAARLREDLKEVFDAMPQEDRAIFAEDESLPALAVLTCFNEALDWVENYAAEHNLSDVDQLMKQVLHEPLYETLYRSWAIVILGDYAQNAPETPTLS